MDPTPAHDLYLRGRFVMGHRAEPNLRAALDYFERAVAADPALAPGHVGLSQVLALMSLYGFARPHELMPRARASAERALQLDDSIADAHAALAFALLSYDWDWERAHREFLRALEIDPNDPTTLSYYGFYDLICVRNQPLEGMKRIAKAADLDPLAALPMAMLGLAAHYTERTEDMAYRVREAVEAQPLSWLLHRSMGLVLAAERRFPEAVSAMERAARLSRRNPWVLVDFGVIRALKGDRAEALELHRELEAAAGERYLQAFLLAMIPAALGDVDAALPALGRSFEERDGVLFTLGRHPAFRGVRGDPRIRELVDRIGLPE